MPREQELTPWSGEQHISSAEIFPTSLFAVVLYLAEPIKLCGQPSRLSLGPLAVLSGDTETESAFSNLDLTRYFFDKNGHTPHLPHALNVVLTDSTRFVLIALLYRFTVGPSWSRFVKQIGQPVTVRVVLSGLFGRFHRHK